MTHKKASNASLGPSVQEVIQSKTLIQSKSFKTSTQTSAACCSPKNTHTHKHTASLLFFPPTLQSPTPSLGHWKDSGSGCATINRGVAVATAADLCGPASCLGLQLKKQVKSGGQWRSLLLATSFTSPCRRAARPAPWQQQWQQAAHGVPLSPLTAPSLGPPVLSLACLVNQRCFVPPKLHSSHTAVFPVFPVQTGPTAIEKRLLTQWAATLHCHLGHESAGWDGSAQLG